jgi:hypothetical protein
MPRPESFTRDLETILSNTDVKGFPIVSADGALTLVGYIDRSELRYVIGRFSDQDTTTPKRKLTYSCKNGRGRPGEESTTCHASSQHTGTMISIYPGPLPLREMKSTTSLQQRLGSYNSLLGSTRLALPIPNTWRLLTSTPDANDCSPRASLGNRHANLQTDGVSTRSLLSHRPDFHPCLTQTSSYTRRAAWSSVWTRYYQRRLAVHRNRKAGPPTLMG